MPAYINIESPDCLEFSEVYNYFIFFNIQNSISFTSNDLSNGYIVLILLLILLWLDIHPSE